MSRNRFENYLLNEDLLKAIAMLNFESPTKVQDKVIPIALEKKDIIVKSQTGSGKTAAFAIPLCELIEWEENKPQVLVLTPTRELALQVKEDFFNIGRFKRIKGVALYGKSSFYSQQKDLKQKTHVIVGTPGRVLDHLQRGTLCVTEIKYLVIDEADEMLNMGFIEQVETIINHLPNKRTTMLFSATMPPHIQSLCKNHMKEPLQIEIEAQNLTADKVEQERYTVKEIDKAKLLQDVTIIENPDSCIVFCNTKQKVDEVYELLKGLAYTCERLHGGMEQEDRVKVMNHFKKGSFRYLIATDVAARGIDIESITHIINYDIPEERESYVHRIGRTGRASKEGRAISFVTPYENKFLQDIHTYIDMQIPLKEAPTQQAVSLAKDAFWEKMNIKPKLKEEKGHKLGKEILKIHINAGKKTKMRPVDIVGTLCSIEGMTADDIGIINVLDISTFVEILNNKGEGVLKALQNTPIKGRIRKVSRADM